MDDLLKYLGDSAWISAVASLLSAGVAAAALAVAVLSLTLGYLDWRSQTRADRRASHLATIHEFTLDIYSSPSVTQLFLDIEKNKELSWETVPNRRIALAKLLEGLNTIGVLVKESDPPILDFVRSSSVAYVVVATWESRSVQKYLNSPTDLHGRLGLRQRGFPYFASLAKALEPPGRRSPSPQLGAGPDARAKPDSG